MLPGKKYLPEDFVRIAWTRRWHIVLPTVVIGLATFGWASSLPDRYRAETTLQVVPQQVPQAYVRPTVTTDISQRLQAISQEILSRTRLEAIVQEFNLYARERETMIMEDIIDRMRTTDISVNVTGGRRARGPASSFTVGFQSSSPRTAQQVTERLAALFVQENLEDRALLADSTSEFLEAQLEDARRRLIEHEQKLAEFRTKYSGRLPTQLQSNLQLMQSSQAQLQATSEAAARDRDRLAAIDAELSATAPVSAAATAEGEPRAATAGPAAQQLEAARTELRNMELRLKPTHPDIARAKRTIVELEQKAELEAALQPVGEDPALAAQASESPRAHALRLEAEEIRRRLDSRRQLETRLQQSISALTARIETAPALESELTELMRDYSIVQESYASLKRKSEDAKLAANLERRQIGEQFKVIDSARLPERPFSPDRLRLSLMGIAGGLGFGLALVALLEYRDTTFKNDNDIVMSLALPVIAIVPAMHSGVELRRMKARRRRMAVMSACLVLVAAVVVAWRLRLLPGWIG
jgi:polysaccharide chain length determinant protein (PEP-CTERM system associated)